MLEPIRVLHVLGNLNAGGAESRTMDIYRNIDKRKIQFDFAIHTEEECFFTNEVLSLGGRIYNFPRFNGRNYRRYKKAWSTFFREHPEYKTIHGHISSTAFIYLNEALKNNVPIRIAHSRNSNKDSIIKKYLSMLSRFYATDLLAVSKLAGQSEFGKTAVNNGKVKIIPNAIDVKKYTYDKDIRMKKRYELGVTDKLCICNIGRFHPQKNHTFTLKVFKAIKEKEKNAVLFLIGDGVLRTDIEQQIKLLGLEESVILTGVREDVPELLQAMDILLFPSHFEGFPGVVLEAQAAALPSVISDTITREIKITQLVDFVSLDEDPGLWADKVLNKVNSFERKKVNDKIVEAGYDIESVSQWYENFYQQKL